LKKVKGAALDVFSKEPIDANSYLLREPNLFLTPHTGAFSHTAWKNSSMEAVKKAFSFTQGIMPQDQLPLATPWFKKTLDIT
jgi:D-3-phosphoglycerate dehydrogenase / 2-oxoglutarate reductase